MHADVSTLDLESRSDRATLRNTVHVKTMTKTDEPRWVACSEREFGPSGSLRHLARPGALSTLCGFSATYPEIWRGNTTKPKCAACERIEHSLASERSQRPVTPGHVDGIRLPHAAERAVIDAVASMASAKSACSPVNGSGLQ